MSTLDKLVKFIEETAVFDGEGQAVTPTMRLRAVRTRLMEIELRDARRKLHMLNYPTYRAALVDCIVSSADAYSVQQSYTLDMFLKLPLALTSIVQLIGELERKLAQYNLDLPNSLQNFSNTASSMLGVEFKMSTPKSKAAALAELEES